MNREEFTRLAGRISDGTASEQDIARYDFYYKQFQSAVSDSFHDSDEKENIDKELRSRIGLGRPVRSRKLHPYWKAAAAIVLLASVVFLFKDINQKDQLAAAKPETGRFKYDAAPGGNNAVLTLADGSTIVLNEAENGTLIKRNGIAVSKTKDGQVVYNTSGRSSGLDRSSALTYNTISIPKGGQYQITLSDGTKVWLNSASSLKFPTVFDEAERKVELSGEAYFEVAKKVKGKRKEGERIPFIVKSGSQLVEVLGTHFNVMAYEDESTSKTTLLEGSVKVSHLTSHVSPKESSRTHLLKPGQQALLRENKIQVQEADTEEAVAWKNGMFQFNNTDMQTIMRRLERWYNVEADEENMPHKRFNGIISRDVPLSQVLKMMEITSGLKFQIDEMQSKGGKPERRISMAE